jgi:uncharacterized protein YndB with AHSA1/START domain
MSSLTIVKTIAARPEIVFDALIEPEGLRMWIGPDDGPVLIAESDGRVGGNSGCASKCSTVASTRQGANIWKLSAPAS